MYEAPPAYDPEPQRRVVRVSMQPHNVVLAWVFLAAIVALFAFSVLRGFSPMGVSDDADAIDDLVLLISLGAKFTPLMDLDGQWWRLASAMFLHGSLIHLAINGYALYILGPDVERMYGTARFAAIYMGAGLAGSAASYGFGDISAPAIGASGAIFGLMGAMGAFAFSSRAVLGDVARRNLRQIAGLAAINLLIGFSLSGIDNYAHLGGLVGGTALGLLLAPRLEFVPDPLQPAIRSHPSGPARWLGFLAVLAVVAGLTALIHHLRLDDPKARSVLVESRNDYLDFAP
ncbi:MAG TPA: rhomboid family intramembrane serine protease [Herpetosiphonaceae bacterium]|nr:rhomboid family intramembrane serine protease [Herpetosiphonaceae bacterium]